MSDIKSKNDMPAQEEEMNTVPDQPIDTDQKNLTASSQPKEKAVIPYDPLQMYLREIKRYNLLSREEEMKLAIRFKEKGDQKAAYILVTSNLRLVVKIAMDFNRIWTRNLLDLIQEGNLGLLQAVQKFDPYRGIKLSYYASFWIKAYILKFIMDNWKLVKIGTTQTQRKLFFNLAKERDKLIAQGFSPEPRLLAERLDVKEDDIVEMSQRLGGWELSLSSPISDDSKESFGSLLPDPGKRADDQISDHESRRLLKTKLGEFRETLEGKEAEIFDQRIMAEKPLTLQDLGDKYNISRERVRQIQEKIIRKAKKWLKENIPNFEEEYADFMN